MALPGPGSKSVAYQTFPTTTTRPPGAAAMAVTRVGRSTVPAYIGGGEAGPQPWSGQQRASWQTPLEHSLAAWQLCPSTFLQAPRLSQVSVPSQVPGSGPTGA